MDPETLPHTTKSCDEDEDDHISDHDHNTGTDFSCEKNCHVQFNTWVSLLTWSSVVEICVFDMKTIILFNFFLNLLHTTGQAFEYIKTKDGLAQPKTMRQHAPLQRNRGNHDGISSSPSEIWRQSE